MTARRLSRDIIGVFTTRVAWTLMSMVAGVILARKLGPHDRGILALVLLVPSTVVTLSKLGISQSNVYFINRKRERPEDVAANSAVFAVAIATVSIAVVWSVRDLLFSTVLRGVEPWALAIALVRVPLLLLDDYLYGVLQATGRFSLYNTRLVLSESLRMVLITGALVGLGMGLFAAVVIYTVVTAVNVAWLVVATRRLVPFSLWVNRRLLREQLRFGLKSYFQTLTSHMLLRADVYLVSYFLTPSHTAFYSLALRFTEMVLEIPQAVGLVIYPRLASLPERQVYQLTAQACRRTLLLAGTGAVLIGTAGPFLITLIYGRPFAPAGDPLPWAAVGAVAMSMFVILTRAFTSQNRQQVNISAGLTALVSNLSLNIFLIPWLGIVGAAMATALAYSAACALLLVFFIKASGMSLSEIVIARRDDLQFFWQMLRQLAAKGWSLVTSGLATVSR